MGGVGHGTVCPVVDLRLTWEGGGGVRRGSGRSEKTRALLFRSSPSEFGDHFPPEAASGRSAKHTYRLPGVVLLRGAGRLAREQAE